ncbi:MAG TPA: hypothetical protein VFQ77_12600 [Pseudonocardiaceae bacterium]|nr:hypothetical protein [Pseudonocardiaceae bacterium]
MTPAQRMPEPKAAHRRTVLGPVPVTGALVLAGTVPALLGTGWVLAWLLLGLTAGYALSGSA